MPAAVPSVADDGENRRPQVEAVKESQADGAPISSATSQKLDTSATGLAKSAAKSALSGGLTPSAAVDLALLPLRLLGIPTNIHPTAWLPSILSLGPVPEHIAFIMDGNRRYAKSSSMSVRQGHMSGFQTLKRILEACLKMQKVKCVTVYAFAIDNFKRDPGEVDALMQLAKTRLLEMTGHGELVSRHSVRIRVIGQKHLLPPDVRAAVEKVELMTKNHSRATLNICMPYASRDEIACAMRKAISNSLLEEDHASLLPRDASTPPERQDISKEGIDANMMLAHSPPVDILVRTSGVSRLSDFMLWQANEHTQLHFTDCYWPEFGWKELAPIILDYQRQRVAQSARDWLRAQFAQ